MVGNPYQQVMNADGSACLNANLQLDLPPSAVKGTVGLENLELTTTVQNTSKITNFDGLVNFPQQVGDPFAQVSDNCLSENKEQQTTMPHPVRPIDHMVDDIEQQLVESLEQLNNYKPSTPATDCQAEKQQIINKIQKIVEKNDSKRTTNTPASGVPVKTRNAEIKTNTPSKEAVSKAKKTIFAERREKQKTRTAAFVKMHKENYNAGKPLPPSPKDGREKHTPWPIHPEPVGQPQPEAKPVYIPPEGARVVQNSDPSHDRVLYNDAQKLDVLLKEYDVPIGTNFGQDYMCSFDPETTKNFYVGEVIRITMPDTLISELTTKWLVHKDLTAPSIDTWTVMRKVAMSWFNTVRCSPEVVADSVCYAPFMSWLEAKKLHENMVQIQENTIYRVRKWCVTNFKTLFTVFVILSYTMSLQPPEFSVENTTSFNAHVTSNRYVVNKPTSMLWILPGVAKFYSNMDKIYYYLLHRPHVLKYNLENRLDMDSLNRLTEYSKYFKIPPEYVCEDEYLPYYMLPWHSCKMTDIDNIHTINSLETVQLANKWLLHFTGQPELATNQILRLPVSNLRVFYSWVSWQHVHCMIGIICIQILIVLFYNRHVGVFVEEFIFGVTGVLFWPLAVVLRLLLSYYENRNHYYRNRPLYHLALQMMYAIMPRIWYFTIIYAHILLNINGFNLNVFAAYHSMNSYLPKPEQLKPNAFVVESDYLDRYLKKHLNSHKRQQTQYEYGINAGDWRPTYFSSNKNNELQALYGRILKATPVPDEQEIDKLVRFVKKNHKTLFGFGQVRPVSIETYLERSNATTAVKAKILAAHLKNQENGVDLDSVLDKATAKRWTTRKCFVKVENMNYRTPFGVKKKFPRPIQGGEPELVELAGRWLQPFQGYVKKRWNVNHFCSLGSGLDNFAIANKINRTGWTIVENDISAWDGSVCEKLHKLVLWIYSKHGCPKCVLQLLRADVKTHGITASGYRYGGICMVNSGNQDTTLRNGIINIVMHTYIFFDETGLPLRVIMDIFVIVVNGDDMVMAHKQLSFTIDWVTRCAGIGFESKAIIRREIDEIEFCSNRIYTTDRGLAFGPKPGKVLSKFGYFINPPNVPHSQLMRGVALGLWNSCSYIPPIRAVLQRVLDLTSTEKEIKPKYEEWKMHYKYAEANETTMYELFKAYNWTPSDQLELEEKLKTWSFGERINMPSLDRMYDVDTSGPKYYPSI